MKILFFDTETTGVPANYKSEPKYWPRLVQLSFIVTDENGNRFLEADHIVKPKGFQIPKDASDIHGISHEKATKIGQPLEAVLRSFGQHFKAADLIVAHNYHFDRHIVDGEFYRVWNKYFMPLRPSFCTMKATTEWMALPGRYGFKFPKLTELYLKLFDREFDNQHNALFDTQATVDIYFELVRREIIPAPETFLLVAKKLGATQE